MNVPKDAVCSMPHDHQRSLHDLCRKYMHYHVVLKMKDGSSVHGILEGVNRQEASVLVPEDVTETDERQFYGGYGYPRRRFRRFRRRIFPFVFIAALYPFPYY
ncbi:small nuclear ribonucleoprotein [Bacillus haynesii]|uniref:Small nuclear ribonucleoprotein n=1 Tax=Bacillus haynesii TaxID=1925021 RepID=A0ABX3I5X2_9BACI|nr:small nuclear ribonucleoprotein [Bacillus haynesii]OMI28809.1 small nuclear ribonucleoprotein [Bacillus haynesii]